MEKLENQICPFCGDKKLALTEEEIDVSSFGKVFLFSMNCSNCNYHKSDVESEAQKDPVKINFTVESEKDMNIKVVKSSEARVSVPQMRISVEPGPDSEGYVSNIEGVLDRFKKMLEDERDIAEDDDVKKNAKNQLKKLWKVKLGDIPLKIIIEDTSGNSAIVSNKAKVEKLKVK